MRLALWSICLALAVGACGGKDDGGGNGANPSATKTAEQFEREQKKFDAERRPEEVIKALGIGPGSRVADVGANTGQLTLHLARAVSPGGTVVATDIEGPVLELLQQRLAHWGVDGVVERRIVGEDAPGLEAGAYDAILLAEVDHYFKDHVAWFEAAIPALKPGGRLVISNRLHHRAKALAMAKKAGLVLQSESTPVPTHFIAVFGPPAAKPPK